jgi:hypothetical protein
MKIATRLTSLLLFLAACQSATLLPIITAETGSEFTLGISQSATLPDTGLTITLEEVTGDERCPSEIECAMSGPVSLTISVQKDSEAPVEFALQTFTSNNGRAPDGPYERIEDRIEYEGDFIQVKSVLPYPAHGFDEIEDSEYRASFLVSAK